MKYCPNGFAAAFSLWVVCVSGSAFAQQSFFPSWSAYAGEEYESEGVLAVATDSQNNTFFGGFLGGGGLVLQNDDGVLATANDFSLLSAAQDGFVAKADNAGHLLWYTPICDLNDDRVNAVAVHTDGTVYAAGTLGRSGTGAEGTDATLTSLSGTTGYDTWTVKVGDVANATNGFNAVAVDSDGSIYAAGYASVSNLQNTVSGSQYQGRIDALVVKVSPTGSVVWTCYLGGTNADTAAALALGPDGSVYVGGQTRSPGWTSVPTTTTGPSTPDGFVAKLNSAGATVWSACIGGSASNAVTALAKSPSSSALYLGGTTTSSGFCSGANRLNSTIGGGDGFVVALADQGTSFQTNWCRFFGSNGADRVTALNLRTNGFLAVGGATVSGGWLTQVPTTSFSGVQDGFVSVLGSDGYVSWSAYIGGTQSDGVSALAVRGEKLVVAGSTFSAYPLGWVDGGFWADWSKDSDYDGEPDFDADLSYGFLSVWSAEAGVTPTITDQPDNLTANEGDSASFSVSATGTAPLTYRWFRNGVPIAGPSTNTFVVASVAPTNNGDFYTCAVSNYFGGATSTGATLTVIAKGTLTVTLSPAQAVSQGAKWSMDGGASWFASGAGTNVFQNTFTVTFTNLTGWVAPAPLTGVQVLSGKTTATSGVYTAILPSAARAISGTNVTVTVSAPAGLSTWTLVETLAAGVTPTNITAGGVWNSGARTITFTGVEATTNTYSYTALCATSGVYTVSGTVTPQYVNTSVAVTGDCRIIKGNFIRKIVGTTVSITVTQPLSATRWYLYEYLPSGLTPTNITGPVTYSDETEIDWYKRGVGETVTYQVTGAPGTYTLSGEGQIGTSPFDSVVGDSVVTIAAPEPVPPPDILSLLPTGTNACTLTFTSVVNQAYVILTNAAPASSNSWTSCLSVTGEAGTTQRTVPKNGPHLFYRVRTEP